MKFNLFICIALILFGCNKQPIEDISYLNGYWEIEKVTFPSEETKTYKVNTLIDHIQLQKDSSGVREKVIPKLDGRFVSMNENEDFSIEKEGEKLFLTYTNEEDSRKEELILLTQDRFGVKNAQNKEYYYKRFEKFSLK
ncbi:hypothetical protein HX109_12120 [Galbibacter sp. BG1]|uniref:hypothetical protein n=1 Tax=Galbibacter sp. BG1 TaxID=1170699 RepID=UPI0015B7C28E|nr:hypothetical protein [Galbibacter sp. BG1]QLE02267.1 hypothetical protein HX109_12120 [Galbibacter sp. BG1]